MFAIVVTFKCKIWLIDDLERKELIILDTDSLSFCGIYLPGAVAWSVEFQLRIPAVPRSTLMSGTFIRGKFISLFR